MEVFRELFTNELKISTEFSLIYTNCELHKAVVAASFTSEGHMQLPRCNFSALYC